MERETPANGKRQQDCFSGYLPLTPVTEETRYMAYAVIG